jgi:hypothetical protein
MVVSARDSYIYTEKKPAPTTQANQPQQLSAPNAPGNHLSKAGTR